MTRSNVLSWPSGSSFVFDYANERREYGPASAIGDRLCAAAMMISGSLGDPFDKPANLVLSPTGTREKTADDEKGVMALLRARIMPQQQGGGREARDTGSQFLAVNLWPIPSAPSWKACKKTTAPSAMSLRPCDAFLLRPADAILLRRWHMISCRVAAAWIANG
jgi:hypothetical protein